MSILNMLKCAGCDEFQAVLYRPVGQFWFCQRCTPRQSEGFSPEVGGTVRLVGDHASSKYVILAFDGDQVTLRRLGFPPHLPSGRPFTRSRWDLDALTSPGKGCSSIHPDSPPYEPPKEAMPSETPADLLTRAAKKLREPGTQVPATALEDLAEWFETAAGQVMHMVLPFSYAPAFRTALAVLGESSNTSAVPVEAAAGDEETNE